MKKINFLNTFKYSSSNIVNTSKNKKCLKNFCMVKNFSSVHVDRNDDTFFKSIKDWWDVNGTMRTLHEYNDVRIKYLKNQLTQEFTGALFENKISNQGVGNSMPFKKLNMLDVGCGGGILCESLARLGADIIGIDSNANSFNIASAHLNNYEGDELKYMQGKLKYYNGSTDNYIEDARKSDRHIKQFDVVLAMEVIEHVNSPELFAKDLSTLTKDGGYLFISTINKTNISYYGMIVAGEKLFGIVPEGTHDWNKFIKPEKLIQILKENGYCLKNLSGVSYNPITGHMDLSSDLSMNYILFAKKLSR